MFKVEWLFRIDLLVRELSIYLCRVQFRPRMLFSSETMLICFDLLATDGASKHALQAYCDSLRAEVASSGIRVTTFNPGYIKTNISVNAVTDTGANYGCK